MTTSSSPPPICFLSQVNETVNRVMNHYPNNNQRNPWTTSSSVSLNIANTPRSKKRKKNPTSVAHSSQGTDDRGARTNAEHVQDTTSDSGMDPATSTCITPSQKTTTAVLQSSMLPESMRLTVSVAHSLRQHLDHMKSRNRCWRCWFPKDSLCICAQTPPAEDSLSSSSLQTDKDALPTIIHRLFLILHPKEIGMAVDTAKMILAAYPTQCRLVVSGIGSEYQDSMKELQDALEDHPMRCLVLFPSPHATTVANSTTLQDLKNVLQVEADPKNSQQQPQQHGASHQVDVIVLDGTWKQARRMYHRYLEHIPNLTHICLSNHALHDIANNNSSNNSSQQLRPHPEAWRQIGTCAATRYLLQDLQHFMSFSYPTSSNSSRETTDSSKDAVNNYYDHQHILSRYQQIVNCAAQQLKSSTK